MKKKAKGHHIPTRDEDPGIIREGIDKGSKFKKPVPTIEKYKAKGDTVE
jgi:hypothetical protein